MRCAATCANLPSIRCEPGRRRASNRDRCVELREATLRDTGGIRNAKIGSSHRCTRMNDINPIIPIPRVPITVRPGTMDDLPFMDELQKIHTKQVGWMPTKQFEGKIKLGQVIIAEDSAMHRVGYCIGHDRYFSATTSG